MHKQVLSTFQNIEDSLYLQSFLLLPFVKVSGNGVSFGGFFSHKKRAEIVNRTVSWGAHIVDKQGINKNHLAMLQFTFTLFWLHRLHAHCARLLYVLVLTSNVYDACVCACMPLCVCVCVWVSACVCVLFICIVQRNWACLTWKSTIETKSLLSVNEKWTVGASDMWWT